MNVKYKYLYKNTKTGETMESWDLLHLFPWVLIEKIKVNERNL